ncbi:MAG: YhfC family glutamic-type intramembrane protease [Erysipelotrichaceae bacterium]|nr:YhfC family glutamic-type intramembrane protease [Erysipelotrichaceae bacterium]
MVSTLSVFNMIVTTILIFGLPVAVIFFLRKKGIITAMLAGSMGFIIGSQVFRMPVVQLILSSSYGQAIIDQPVFYALLLGVSAALFEFVGRLITIFYIRKRFVDKEHIMAAGIGHGAIEAIFVVGLTYINNILLANMINNGTINTLINENVTQQMIDTLVATMTSANPWIFLVAGLERLMTVVIHVALTFLVFQGIKTKKYLPFFGMAIGAHALLDTMSALLSLWGVSIWIIELFVFSFMWLGIYVIVIIWKRMKQAEHLQEIAP